MAKKVSEAVAVKPRKVEQTQEFKTLEEALAFIESLRRKKAIGYLNVGSWFVRWKQ